jgi:hypothetical protein
MDATSAYMTGGATASIMIVSGLLYKFWNTIKNHMVVSRCCGRKMEMGIGVVDMPGDTPEQKLEIKVPGG